MSEDTTTSKETLGFRSEVTQLLELMVNSLYGNREIFLRELISNAADAADKLRFDALADDSLYEDDPDLKIRVDVSEATGTITIVDNGIGMSREDAVEHLGTIAKSGTKEFFSRLTGEQQTDSQLIGQFGVGFYSAFIVADRVVVRSRRAGAPSEDGVVWESEGKGEFTVESVPTSARGTSITLYLKDDAREFLDPYRLRGIITKYSDHIGIPIEMEKPAEPSGQGDEDEQAELVTPGQPYEAVNRATALWLRPKRDITEDEYKAFYKHVAHDFEDPMLWLHNRVEGKTEYTSLLFIPARAPFDLWDRDSRHGVKLYVRRVFIMDDAEQLMPRYLRFVRGVIDTNDLPLNVSREILQQNQVIDAIRTASVKRVLSRLQETAEKSPDSYQEFWDTFGRVLKEGVIEDFANRDTLASLLRFASTRQEKESVSLQQYKENMQADQKAIYVITAENRATALNSPHLEVFKDRGIEVLLLSDPVDEWLLNHLSEFEETPIKQVNRGSLDVDELPAKPADAAADNATGEDEPAGNELIDRIKTALGERIKDARVTDRLTRSPACLVADESDMGANLQRILAAAGQDVAGEKPILEVNLRHPLVQRMRAEADAELADWALLLFEQALLSEGGRLEEPASFVQRLNDKLLELAG